MKLFALFFSSMLFLGCTSNSDSLDCTQYEPARVVAVAEVQNADSVGFLFDVDFQVNNGCGQFFIFEENTVGNETTISVIAKYEGCVCTDDLPLRETVYSFLPIAAGTYVLKFKMEGENYITKTVTKL